MRRRRWLVAVSIVIGVAGVSWSKAHSSLFVWNVSRSVPVGLYVIVERPPLRGELAALRLPEPMRSLADARRYLATKAILLKPVGALAGDTVCRRGAIVAINGRPVARALTVDASGRPLPQWSGCHDIDERQLFVLSDDQYSFDGRYFGVVDVHHVIGTAVAVTVQSVLAAAGKSW